MQKRVISILLVINSLWSLSAIAALDTSPVPYFGVGVVNSAYKFIENSLASGTYQYFYADPSNGGYSPFLVDLFVDDQPNGIKTFGGARFNGIWAIEGGLINFGQYEIQAASAYTGPYAPYSYYFHEQSEIKGAYAAGVFESPIGKEWFSVNARIGLLLWGYEGK
ncbi:MAG: hypothetical protein H0W44_03890 [Gammaproteobacteria bacterium]|nr:hypothetical protein [Gammaproteobacteria bacterium]